MGREEALRRQLMEAQEGITQRDAFLRQLQEETALSASALKQAARVGGRVGGRGEKWGGRWWKVSKLAAWCVWITLLLY